MKIIKNVLLILIVIMVSSCSTGKKALQHGDYSTAVMKAVERLRDSPDNKKSSETLKDAYPLALETLQREIDQILRSSEPLKYGQVVSKYELINSMADEIRRCPAALKIITNPTAFPDEIKAAREKAAPEAYNAALALLDEGTRESAKEAYYLLLEADRYSPGFEDVKEKIQESHYLATLKIVVEQIPVPGRYKISSEFFYDEVMAFLKSGVRREFVEFYTPKEAGKLPFTDQVIVMEFYDFVVGTTRESDSEKEVTSADSVKVGSVTIDGKKVDVFDRVKAKFKTYRREVASSGLLQVEIVDSQSKKELNQRKFPGSFTWFNEWATFNGDERALTDKQFEMTKLKPALPPPPQDLFIEFTKPILDQLKSYIRSYYRNY